jgi:hypothetical protein
VGVAISSLSSNNLLYHNTFINNTQNAEDAGINNWYNGYPSGGNYWDDYTGVDNFQGPAQDIPGSDGIGDTSYLIPDGSNQDLYPLMTPPLLVTITLQVGWNLITIPVGNNFWASTLGEQISGCEIVSRWDGENQTYRSYIVGGPPGLDFPISNGFAYFILVNQSSTLLLGGPRIDSASVSLYNASDKGWNMIGWYHSYNTTASSLGTNITGCEVVSRWDAVNDTYRSYIIGGPPGLDFTITCGMGLFVLVNESSVWHGEG